MNRRNSKQEGIHILPVTDIKEVFEGDSIAELIAQHFELLPYDVVVVTQKIVSKADGNIQAISANDPDAFYKVVESESVRILRKRMDKDGRGLIISETKYGFVCANAGVDRSNVEDGYVTLLPPDPDKAARKIRDRLRAITSLDVGVIVSDTFGRAWRRGLCDVAIGCAGIAAVMDLRGKEDSMGHELKTTEVCIADELASAAELVMGKADKIPVVVVRGVNPDWFRESSVKKEIIRKYSDDLFR
ncbi:MAG: coenzyme F420-0:L-glutamate ligase [Actinobacteria bacterium]|nr:coenzyme F420-0:L-glutamate ligase [Actinomycetota bacterium]MCL6105298.1 coenzyme F420-0:L-glutamate ligase [Actinomycetota bacterium]